jgi:ribosomal protein S21
MEGNEMKKNANVSVNIRQCGNNVDKMIRKFIKKTKKEKIVEQVRERRYYKKPSVAKKEKRIKAQRLRMQEERKRRRAQERRNRNNK